MNNKFFSTLLLVCALPLAFCPASRAAVAPVETTLLPNGSTLLVRRDQVSPRASVSLMVRVGENQETADTAGWRQVLGAAMLRSTKIEGDKYIRFEQWQARAEDWGGEIGASVGDDFIEFSATGLGSRAPEMLAALMLIARQPRLDDADFVAARRRALQLQSQQPDAVAARAAQAIAGQLYRDKDGKATVYALPDYGTFESLSKTTDQQLRGWHDEYFKPSHYVIAASGDVDAAALRGVLSAEKTSGKPQTLNTKLDIEIAPTFAPLDASRPPLVVRESNTLGAWVFVAFRTPGPEQLAPGDLAALEVLNASLSGGALARLRGVDTTDKDDLAQTAVQWTLRRYAGELILIGQTGPQNVDKMKNTLIDQTRKLGDSLLSNAELQSAKNYARGRWATDREGLHGRAFEAAQAKVLGGPVDTRLPDEFAAVTPEAVRRVAQKYLKSYSVVLILPQS